MNNNRFSSIFWDFGGVITSSPFEAFNRYEFEVGLPKDFIRKINSTNSDKNAWALLEQSKISLDEFDSLFAKESNELGFEVRGSNILALLQGDLRPEILKVLKKLKSLGFKQACLTNNFDSGEKNNSALDDKNEERIEIMSLFDHIIESKIIGVRKPDIEFYKIALQITEADPLKTIFLDDLGINLKTAKKMGISTIKVFSGIQAINELENLIDVDLS